jgi:hypothetical protein
MHTPQDSRGSPLATPHRRRHARTRRDPPSAQEWREDGAPDGGVDGRADGPRFLASAGCSRARSSRSGSPRRGRRVPLPPPRAALGPADGALPVVAVATRSALRRTSPGSRTTGRACSPNHQKSAERGRAGRTQDGPALVRLADGGGPHPHAAGPVPRLPCARLADDGGRSGVELADGGGAPPAGLFRRVGRSSGGSSEASEHLDQATVVVVFGRTPYRAGRQ